MSDSQNPNSNSYRPRQCTFIVFEKPEDYKGYFLAAVTPHVSTHKVRSIAFAPISRSDVITTNPMACFCVDDPTSAYVVHMKTNKQKHWTQWISLVRSMFPQSRLLKEEAESRHVARCMVGQPGYYLHAFVSEEERSISHIASLRAAEKQARKQQKSSSPVMPTMQMRTCGLEKLALPQTLSLSQVKLSCAVGCSLPSVADFMAPVATRIEQLQMNAGRFISLEAFLQRSKRLFHVPAFVAPISASQSLQQFLVVREKKMSKRCIPVFNEVMNWIPIPLRVVPTEELLLSFSPAVRTLRLFLHSRTGLWRHMPFAYLEYDSSCSYIPTPGRAGDVLEMHRRVLRIEDAIDRLVRKLRRITSGSTTLPMLTAHQKSEVSEILRLELGVEVPWSDSKRNEEISVMITTLKQHRDDCLRRRYIVGTELDCAINILGFLVKSNALMEDSVNSSGKIISDFNEYTSQRESVLTDDAAKLQWYGRMLCRYLQIVRGLVVLICQFNTDDVPAGTALSLLDQHGRMVGAGHHCLRDYCVDITRFEESVAAIENSAVDSEEYRVSKAHVEEELKALIMAKETEYTVILPFLTQGKVASFVPPPRTDGLEEKVQRLIQRDEELIDIMLAGLGLTTRPPAIDIAYKVRDGIMESMATDSFAEGKTKFLQPTASMPYAVFVPRMYYPGDA